MCGRYYADPIDLEMRELAEEMNRSPLAERFRKKSGEPLSFAGDILPSSIIPAIASDRAGRRKVFPMKWGFATQMTSGSSRTGLLINARTETAALKLMFRESWAKHRCAIPASLYYEWEHTDGQNGRRKIGRKYAIRPETEGPVWLAGLYRLAGGIPECVILTRQADESIAWMHDRMPLMLPADRVSEWIRPDADPAKTAGVCLTRVRWNEAG